MITGEVDVHIGKNYFKYICYLNFTLEYNRSSDTCFYLHVTMETVANEWEILIQYKCKNPDDINLWHLLLKFTKC